jgi:DNA-binding GntR family transcriptional regulator
MASNNAALGILRAKARSGCHGAPGDFNRPILNGQWRDRFTWHVPAWPPRKFELMRRAFVQQGRNNEQGTEKAPFLVIQKIRKAILDETFKPGDRLPEAELGEMFEVSRSPVREALLALEKEGTVIIEAYKGAIVKPLSPEEALDMAEIRLALITLAAKRAHRHLSPADFDLAYRLAKQMTRSNSAKEHFEYNRRFWDVIFEKTQRPILWEVFTQLDDRSTRYNPLLLKLFPDPATRPRQREVLIELYRKGKVDEALRTFKKIYLDMIHQAIDSLRSQPVANSSDRGR